jgi:biopolymer transport protein ExbD
MKRASQIAFPEEEPEFQVAPMIDVLLVLMTFFMSITSTEVLKTTAKNFTVELPVAKDSKKKEDARREIVVNIGWDKQKLNGVIEVSEKVIDDPDKLTPLIVEKRGSNPVFRAVLRASSDVPYRYMQLVMAACAKADVDNITFMVLDKEGKKNYGDKKKGDKK